MNTKILSGTLSAIAAGTALSTIAAEKETKPNVLFIVIDDLRTDIGCYGNKLVKTPNIDALASQATLFKYAYCQQAVCAPSRISFLTGLRPDTTGITDLKHPLRKTDPNALSIPQYFKENGYTTISLGKVYHHHKDDNGIGWSRKAWHPDDAPDKKWKGWGYMDPESWKVMQKGNGNKHKGPAYECYDAPENDYSDAKTAEKAVAELAKLKQANKPFFLAVGFEKPHLPFVAPKKYWDMYPLSSIKLPSVKHWPKGMPPFASNGNGTWEISNYPGMPQKVPYPEKLAKTLIRGYYACTTFSDAQVGKVLAALKKLDLDKNTVIVLLGDHGWKLDEYSAWCKHTNFEIDTHAPLIIATPGEKKGEKTNALVEFVDVFPTLCDLCGLKIPATCEGSTLVPLLKNPDMKWKEAAFSQYPRGDLMGYTMRTERWRYTEWINKKTGKIAARELYDHSKSPIATVNLANNPENSETVKKLSAILAKGKGWKKIKDSLK